VPTCWGPDVVMPSLPWTVLSSMDNESIRLGMAAHL
jgi:hypothetical protein